jgi:DNA-binding transcriptional LysR family regulator
MDGQLTFNTIRQLLQAALAGHGLAYVPEGMVEAHVAKGRLKRVLTRADRHSGVVRPYTVPWGTSWQAPHAVSRY